MLHFSDMCTQCKVGKEAKIWNRYNQVTHMTKNTQWEIDKYTKGGQWLSGRVLDSRPRGRGFEPHQRHCVVVLEQDTFILA